LCINHHTGTRPEEGRTAASKYLPAGTILEIDGIGIRIVEDFCGGCSPDHLDIFIDGHDRASAFGRKHADAYIIGGYDG
jgi:3D (Asp-Asp-Asp) domain-containing protein